MERFIDENGKRVELSFQKGQFQQDSNHVLVICRYEGQWLLTRHKKRGLEFPGGKREKGEALEEAAIRETFEETGGVIKEPLFIGEYKVFDHTPFVKTIFFAEAEEMIQKDDYLETEGSVLWDGDFTQIHEDPSFSFIMKDRVVESALKRVRELDLMT
ncbi:nucleoside triphosphatase YtkD [Rossellomorea vietnamensis]|uniref:RNA deprotection pyrophosphohydrolase n=1 Tax=Rossellomorea vietnamensis TaxID=218284 RepID=UPI001CCDA24E|nr:nucleoside triphosphatase YtkD [Rossellomorea vietnamensis]MCA0150905.1 nucleoside triphosphatase YtkD [Rossellomorea vietnamensis]